MDIGGLLRSMPKPGGFAGGFPTDEPSGVNLTVKLKDGTKLVGKNEDESLQLRSEILGKIKLPLEKLRSIDFPAGTTLVQITTTNGDTIAAELSPSRLIWKPPLATSSWHPV